MMERICRLQIQGSIIFGEHVLTIGLLTHLHIGDRVIALLQVGDFGDRVFGRPIN